MWLKLKGIGLHEHAKEVKHLVKEIENPKGNSFRKMLENWKDELGQDVPIWEWGKKLRLSLGRLLQPNAGWGRVQTQTVET